MKNLWTIMLCSVSAVTLAQDYGAGEKLFNGNCASCHKMDAKLIGGGEETTVTFDAPAKGTYDFICSFPGHYALMKGKFIVE